MADEKLGTGRDDPQPVDLSEALLDALGDENGGFVERDPETFTASQIGFCPRQCYVRKLGLTDTSDIQGRFSAGHLVRTRLTEALAEADSTLETNPSISFESGDVRFIGRCTAYDPVSDVVYHIRTRNGWYKFHPPVDRHVDQLHVYMRGLDARRGQLLYVSLNDIQDLRTWPSGDADDRPFLQFDHDRYSRIVAKAEHIRREILINGIATRPDEIPFDPCGCFFCEDETLDLVDGISLEADEAETGAFTPALELDEARPGALGQHRKDTVDLDDVATYPTSSTGYHIPAGLEDLRVWVVWDCREKVARAPWRTETMYPCKWAADGDVDPRNQLEKARIVSQMPVERIHEAWPFPNDDNLPSQVKPAVLLPHETHDPPLCFIDFDDVRDPDTGETTQEVVEMMDDLGGYAEVSQSGTGIHVYVRARLPDGQLVARLEDVGSVEVYDHSRFTAGTWDHVEGTPPDCVPTAQAAVDTIVDRYLSGDVNGGS